MILIVGLGNPGKKFEKTRHNVGFMIVDYLQFTIDKFSDWKLDKKSNAQISNSQMSMVNSQRLKVILAKPQTFMNLSGKSIKSLLNFYNSTRTLLVVIHDDIDLPLGKIRIVKNRGAAGHKGVESIIKELGTKNFIRFRLGIKPQQYHRLVHGTVEKFVLQKFTKDEEKIVKEVIKKTAEAVEFFLKEGLEKVMSKFNY